MNLLQTIPTQRVQAQSARKPVGRRQRTLAHAAEVSGVGMVTGKKVKLKFCPATPDHGVAFLRTDIPGATPIPARAESVTGTARRTTLGSGLNQVTLVEHVLAALSGMRIDNCLVEIDGPEPPGLDGSSEGYANTLLTVGTVLQAARKPRIVVTEPIEVRNGEATLGIYPRAGDELVISYLLNYGLKSPIAPQSLTQVINPDRFRQELARCRTYVLEHEALELQRQGVGRHLKPSEVLVFGPKGLIDNRLRFPDEPARHKILDLVGDLALCGYDLVGHVVAYRSGHPLNVELARALTRTAQREFGRCA
ncbi:MAG TPA: UDP-3-O-acyl-N-acetylglucosamine deacetylase [Gemmataceae bacterium]|jgi:UDP-3-O-acyl N-acetylglucosamine deacetylase|nr:UDP-3-O-acyl-N-acetylglucosamine deacetylase [Gemmataceae bacterium]